MEELNKEELLGTEGGACSHCKEMVAHVFSDTEMWIEIPSRYSDINLLRVYGSISVIELFNGGRYNLHIVSGQSMNIKDRKQRNVGKIDYRNGTICVYRYRVDGVYWFNGIEISTKVNLVNAGGSNRTRIEKFKCGW